MGVQGLWSLVESAGKPVALESLENKVLAVDVSIWLNQAVKGFRDKSGAALPHAHVLGLFHRVCKLLFYRVRPVFVFDGPPPQLKRDTLAARRRRKGRARDKSEASRAKIIQNYLRSRALRARQVGNQTEQVGKILEGGAEQLSALLNKRNKAKDKDVFELPPLPEDEQYYSSDSDREDVLDKLEIEESTDIHQIDINSERFKSLPSHQQAEVLIVLREKRKQNSWAKLGEMPREAQSFSGFQMERLKKRSAMQKRLDEVGNQASEEQAGDLDRKLFVGDREGLREQKRKKKIVGKDFVYLYTEKKKVEPVPGTSKGSGEEAAGFFVDDDDGEDGLTQTEILATLQSGSARGEKSKRTLSSSEEEDEIMIIPSEESVKKSRRTGGIPEIKVEGIDSDTADNERKTTGGERGGSESNTSSDNDFVEVTVKPGEGPPEDDLFADVFADASDADHKKLDSLLSQQPNSGKERAEKGSVPPPLEKAKNADSDHDEEEPDLASSMKEKGHLFLQIAARWAEESQAPKGKKKKAQEADGVSEERTKLEEQLEKDTESLVREMKDLENRERLLRATNRLGSGSGGGGKSVVSKTVASSMKSKALIEVPEKPSTSSSTSNAEIDDEESELFDKMGVGVHEKADYDKKVLGNGREEVEEIDLEKGEKVTEVVKDAHGGEENVVYGASAPGFVRSKRGREEDVVEVERSSDDDVRLDVEILRKLENDPGEDGDEEGLLSRGELERIQAELAREQNQLVAERGKQERLAASVSDQMYADCQELLQLFGLPWIVAPSEAEAQCAFLDMNGLTHGTITEDSDIWVFGGQRVYKHFFNQEHHCEVFSAADLARHFGLSREKMISVAMMTGSDYTEGVENVGPVTAMEVLAEFPAPAGTAGLETLLRFRDWLKDADKPENSVREKFRRIKLPTAFPSSRIAEAYLNPEVDNSLEVFSWAVPNFVEISDFAQEKFGWTRHKVDEIIKPVIRKLNVRVTQARIDNYFQSESITLPASSSGRGTVQNSKRVKSAIQRVLGKGGADSKADSSSKKTARKETKQSSSTSATSSIKPAPKSLVSKKEEEEARKAEAKAKAIEIYKKSVGATAASNVSGGAKRKRTRQTKGRKPPKRIVLEQHNLSETDSD